MKKKLLAVLLALSLFSGIVFAESFAKDGMLVGPRTLNASVGLSWGNVFGGAEYGLGKFDIQKLPLSYGVAGRVGLSFSGGIDAFVGPTLHFCWGAIDWPKELNWIDNFDTYIGLGLGLDIGGTYPLGFGYLEGVSYYFSKNLAVFEEYSSAGWGFGVTFKI